MDVVEHQGMQNNLSSLPSGTAAGADPTSASGLARTGTWRMVLAMFLSGTIGLLVVESGLPDMLVV